MKGLGRLLLFAPILALTACRESGGPSQEEPRQFLENFSLDQSDLGTPIWHLEAKEAVLSDKDQTANLRLPRIRFYKNGRVASLLSSQFGLLHTDTQDLHMERQVVAVSFEDKSVLKTEALDYSSKTKKFLSDKDVLLSRPQGVARGRGMEANSDLSEIRIFHQKAEIKEKGA